MSNEWPDWHYQGSAFITKSDDALYSPDNYIPSSDTLLEYDNSEPFEDLDDAPLDSDEASFMDLFTESESSQDTGNTVCDYLLPAAYLTNDLGCTCNFRIYDSAVVADTFPR